MSGDKHDVSGDLELRHHNAMPNWKKIHGLKIKAIHECEGGGFAVEAEQAAEIVRRWNSHDDLVSALEHVAVLGHGKCTIGKPLADMIRAAIKRAKGEQP